MFGLNRSAVLAAVVAATVMAGSAANAVTLVLWDESASNGSERGLYNFDPDTGVKTLRCVVGPTGSRLNGIDARQSDGAVFAGSSNGEIYRLNPDTGKIMSMGNLNFTVRWSGGRFIRGIAFHPETHKMFGLGPGPKLYAVDLGTVKATLIAKVPGLRAGMAFTPKGELLAISSKRTLIFIDHTTGEVRHGPRVGDLALSNITVAEDGRVFGVQYQRGAVIQIDPKTGEKTNVAVFPEHAHGLMAIYTEPLAKAAAAQTGPATDEQADDAKSRWQTMMPGILLIVPVVAAGLLIVWLVRRRSRSRQGQPKA